MRQKWGGPATILRQARAYGRRYEEAWVPTPYRSTVQALREKERPRRQCEDGAGGWQVMGHEDIMRTGVLVVNRFETATSPWLPTMASESGYAVSVNDGCRACQTTQCGKTRWPSSCLRKHLTRERSSVERPGRESRDYTPPVFGEAGFGEGSLTTSRLGARVTVIVYVPVTEASSAVTVTVMTFSPTSSGT